MARQSSTFQAVASFIFVLGRLQRIGAVQRSREFARIVDEGREALTADPGGAAAEPDGKQDGLCIAPLAVQAYRFVARSLHMPLHSVRSARGPCPGPML